MALSLSSIRDALEGGAPAVVATCAADGTPNVSYLSDVQYVDERHVALSFQFFNKTRANVLANPVARLLVIHGVTAARWRLLVQYLRTETEGALFERMRARLAGIASAQGMAAVFRLRGADVYRVLAIEAVPSATLPAPPRADLLAPLRAAMRRVQAAPDLEALIEAALGAIGEDFEIPHALWLMPEGRRLLAIASRGYAHGGAGAEVDEGQGVIGVAAQVAAPIRINHALAEQAYARVVREQIERDSGEAVLDPAIPLPGLSRPGSQMAVPVCDGSRVLAVLFVEHEQPMRFGYQLEDALAVLADALALAMRRLETWSSDEGRPAAQPSPAPRGGLPLKVRRVPRTDAVFVDNEYVIRGVAGAVLWKMLAEHAACGRCEFTSRELRADPALNLPEVADNLAARLILLQRRLDERPCGLRLVKAGRGRLRLAIERPLLLEAP